jgi:hypothetical protein
LRMPPDISRAAFLHFSARSPQVTLGFGDRVVPRKNGWQVAAHAGHVSPDRQHRFASPRSKLCGLQLLARPLPAPEGGCVRPSRDAMSVMWDLLARAFAKALLTDCL